MISNVYLTIFAFAMLGCVLATPLVTWLATRVGAVDKPDHFRRIHLGAIPRLGGLALAFGVAAATSLTHLDQSIGFGSVGGFQIRDHWSLLIAALVILVVGFVDDTRSIGPRVKLIGQGDGGPGPSTSRDPDSCRRGLQPESRPGVPRDSLRRPSVSPWTWPCPA